MTETETISARCTDCEIESERTGEFATAGFHSLHTMRDREPCGFTGASCAGCGGGAHAGPCSDWS